MMSFMRTIIVFLVLFWIFSGSGLFAQNAWETLPVFHNGRVMPLHTFARQIVREICGTERPFIIQESTDDVDTHGERIAQRLRQLVPREGRYFTADELLFSWILEPDVWTYIPIFPVPETVYLDEIFGVSSPHRVSLYQLEQSQRYKQRCADMHRRHALGQITDKPIPFDLVTQRLENQSQTFLELTFHPSRQRPARMLALLTQSADEQSAYASAFEAWGYLLATGEIPERQTIERSSNSNLHSTTQRWHDIGDKLLLLIQIYERTDSTGNPLLPNPMDVEQQYEKLIDLIDANVTEAAALMESIYPGVAYRVADQRTGDSDAVNVERLLPKLSSPENQPHQEMIRRMAITYYYSVKKLRSEVEAAYLALYDNGRSLRLLPLIRETVTSPNDFDVQPWASAQIILGSGEAFVKRFLDPLMDATGSPIGQVRSRFSNILSSYSSPAGGKYDNHNFIHQAKELQQSIQSAAMHIATFRQPLIDADNQSMVIHAAATGYPHSAAKLLMEYQYAQLRPFDWMWIFALLAMVLNGMSYAAARTRSINSSIVPDRTNSLEEWLFMSSVVMLLLAVVIAGLGATMRARITGWAPFTNMYETVVMTALAAALFGLWYTLAPWFSPALHETGKAAWFKQVRNAVLDRKLFIAVTAGIVFIVGLIATLNRAEFNPDIRPIAAVLRSNFWLTVHVIAIVMSYAAAFIAWGMAVVSLGFALFGRYQRIVPECKGQKTQVLLPATCRLCSPVIERLLRGALLLLIIGTVLGACWADYSWGRFWSWDPKEVWALITILFLAIIFHGKVARYYGAMGITAGALFISIAVIITWYGINFLPAFRGSVHAYGGDSASRAEWWVGVFIAVNILWGVSALLRYYTEIYGKETVE